jgi:Fe-S cluster biogenesis protein NfuA
MAGQQDLRATGDRIEQLLDELRATADPRTYARAEEVLRLVSDLYGAGLTRVVEIVRAGSPALIEPLLADDLLASLFLVHGLHPESLGHRVEAALAGVRPLLAAHGGDVELLGLDSESGAVRLRLLGSCDGCPSSAVTLRSAVERAIVEAAPEIVRIDVDQPSTEPSSVPVQGVPISLGTKPVYEHCPSEMIEA